MELIRTYSEPMSVAGSMLCKVGGMEFVKILSFNFHFDAITFASCNAKVNFERKLVKVKRKALCCDVWLQEESVTLKTNQSRAVRINKDCLAKEFLLWARLECVGIVNKCKYFDPKWPF